MLNKDDEEQWMDTTLRLTSQQEQNNDGTMTIKNDTTQLKNSSKVSSPAIHIHMAHNFASTGNNWLKQASSRWTKRKQRKYVNVPQKCDYDDTMTRWSSPTHCDYTSSLYFAVEVCSVGVTYYTMGDVCELLFVCPLFLVTTNLQVMLNQLWRGYRSAICKQFQACACVKYVSWFVVAFVFEFLD